MLIEGISIQQTWLQLEIKPCPFKRFFYLMELLI